MSFSLRSIKTLKFKGIDLIDILRIYFTSVMFKSLMYNKRVPKYRLYWLYLIRYSYLPTYFKIQ